MKLRSMLFASVAVAVSVAALLTLPVWTAAAYAVAVKPSAPAEGKPAAGDTDALQATVIRAIVAGLAGNFDKYLVELLPARCETAEQKSQLQRYEWKRFSGQAAWYVADPSKPTVTVVRKQAISATKIKLFIKDLKNKDAMPRPIELSQKDGKWLISANSL